MVFSSIVFIFFFLPICLLIYFISPKIIKNIVLLIFSLLFYAWGELDYTFVIVLSIVMNYIWGLLIGDGQSRQRANLGLLLAVLTNLGLLAYFKYTDFFISNLNAVLSILQIDEIPMLNLTLPLGISFFTFQAMSYVIDVYRGSTEPQKNLINLGLYISLFPQLIAGPIVRYHEINIQLQDRKITREGISYGIQRFIIGLGKKAILANNLGLVADNIFALNINGVGTDLAWLAIICYTLQIFYDFSGYSDMAIGLGAIFGFRIPENFNFPYIAKSIREFWRRWHITLSNWFRDYLYIPLGGNRLGGTRTYINLYIVFFLTGLWHGASWNFVIWGLIHGTFMVIERLGFGQWLDKQFAPLRHIYVLLVVIIAWVFFRIETLPDALLYLQSMFIYRPSLDTYHISLFINNRQIFALFIGILLCMPFVKINLNRIVGYAENQTVMLQIIVRAAWLIGISALFIVSLMSLISGSYNPFIYFRF